MIYPQKGYDSLFSNPINHLEIREIMWVKEKIFEGYIVCDPLYSLTLQTIASKQVQAVYQKNYILTSHEIAFLEKQMNFWKVTVPRLPCDNRHEPSKAMKVN